MANILAGDDDEALCTLLKRALEMDGHHVTVLKSGGEIREQHLRWADCIVLDVMMPGEDGFETCRRIRGLADCPIVFLTAKTEEADILTGLGIAGDDYLTKPFRLGELRARIAAHLRREQRIPQNRVRRAGLDFDLGERAVYRQGNLVRLTKGEYGICEYLALHAGQTFSKEQIYEAVFGWEGTSDESAVTEHVKNIRAKLKKEGVSPIETVWGIGYRWLREEQIESGS